MTINPKRVSLLRLTVLCAVDHLVCFLVHLPAGLGGIL